MKIKDQMTGEVKDKGVTAFSPTADDLTTPLTSAASYKKRVDEKRAAMSRAKPPRMPLGHSPPIPEGKLAPIADAARASKLPMPDFGISQVKEPTQAELEDWAPPPRPKGPPPIPGVGAGYAVNQALSRGDTDGPVSLGEAKRMTQQPAEQPTVPAPPAQEVLPPEEKQDEVEYEALPDARQNLEEAEKQLIESGLSYFDVNAVQQARTPLLREERRKEIEDRLAPLEFEDLITKREIVQIVPVIPGKFSVKLRTVREKEYMWILQYLYEKTGVSSPAHVDELTSVCRLVCGVIGINGKPLPEHRAHIGEPGEVVDKDKFETKLGIILGFPTHIVADFGVQSSWFAERVTNLFSVDELKNG